MNSADFQANTPYARLGDLAIDAPADARTSFIRRTYMHLMAAIYGLVALEFVYFQTLPLDELGAEPVLATLGMAGLVRRLHGGQL